MPLQRGFSLIELMIVMVMIAILATVAVPSYSTYMASSRRVEGQAAVLDAASRMERYYSQYHSYTEASLSLLGLASETQNGYYTLSLSNLSANHYTIIATPVATQQGDACGTLSINQLGQKSPAIKGCW